MLANWGLAAYRAAGGMIQLGIAPAYVAYRCRRGKEDPDRIHERQGRPSAPRPDGPLVWVHAASVGETLAVIPVIRRLEDAGLNVLLTTGTLTSSKIVADRSFFKTVHQFVPLDLPGYVRRFLRYWRPALALFVESELWPTKIHELDQNRIPFILINARMSARSQRGWRRGGLFSSQIFDRVTLCLAQSQADADRFSQLGVPDVRVCGNLKFDAPAPEAGSGLAGLRRDIGERSVFLASSTHAGEEGPILEAFGQLKGTGASQTVDPLLIIVPRHPQRGGEVADLAVKAGYRVAQRTQSSPITPQINVYVADTIGEIGLWYRLAGIAFLGGSLIPHGGQNPIEAIKLGAPVLHGPHVGNFADIYGDLDQRGGACAVSSAKDLADNARILTTDRQTALAMNAAASQWLAGMEGSVERTVKALEPFLPQPDRATRQNDD